MKRERNGMSPARAYLNGMAETGQATLHEALNTIARFFDPASDLDSFPWWELRFDDSQKLRAHLVRKYKSRTVNKYLAALRGALKASWRLGLMTTDEYHHARDVRVVKVTDPPAGRRVLLEELRKLITCTPDKRDAALLSILYAAGLRRFEAASLSVEDYDRETGELTVVGKRRKTRKIIIEKSWRAPLEAWLDEYGAEKTAPLFPSREHKSLGKKINLRAIPYIIDRACERVGVPRLTSHDMRRTFITDLLDAGVDIVVVKRLVGHENVNTTAGYDRRGKEAEAIAVEKLGKL